MVGVRHHRAPMGPWQPYGCPCPPGWEWNCGDSWIVPPETRYQRRVREMSDDEYGAELLRRAQCDRAVEEAQAHVKVGDRVRRTRCGGGSGTFTFTHWEGIWMCGVSVSDCHPVNVLSVNRVPVKFGGEI